MFIELTGTGGASTVLEVPANKKLYFIYNNASGAVTVKVTGQTGVSVAAGQKVILVSNGTDVVEATTYLTAVPSSITVTTLNATSASITTATGTTFSATNMGSQSTTQFQGASANITTVTGTTISATNMGAQATTQFQGASANITTITSTSATITNLFDGVGNIRNVPSAGVAKTSAYTLAITDIGEFVTVGSGGSITVPNNIFSAGNAISIYNDTTGNISINCPITTAYLAGTNADRASLTLATRGIATILFINPSLCVGTGNLT